MGYPLRVMAALGIVLIGFGIDVVGISSHVPAALRLVVEFPIVLMVFSLCQVDYRRHS